MSTHTLSNFHEGLEIILAYVIQDFMHSMKQFGLSLPQIHAMMHIYHTGECQVSDIGALADASNAAASQLVERLVLQGLVDRREDPKNRRAKVLRLTEEGKELIRGSFPSPHFLETIDSLTPNQRQTVHEAFRILAQATPHTQRFNRPKEGNHA